MRRLRKPGKRETQNGSETSKTTVQAKKVPGTHACKPSVMPDIPEGEDTVSFERHIRVLQTEWKKPNRNAMVVEELMNRTFAMHRRGVIESSNDVQTVFRKFPFLQDPGQVMM